MRVTAVVSPCTLMPETAYREDVALRTAHAPSPCAEPMIRLRTPISSARARIFGRRAGAPSETIDVPVAGERETLRNHGASAALPYRRGR